MAFRRALPVDRAAQQKQITDKLTPIYQALLRRHRDPDRAYALSYDQAVDLLARAKRVNRDKIRFEERTLLQEIMNDVSR